ncbi:glycine cleavage system protein GcvH [Tindallia californiensis]|uniref:Glycine cleavage system H protein n=1 Tax=Tindallia californiensis TaxID=159292 RepID=A0A1H3MS15_9FIRM|nr:glycine cleavage system protein GcvH [Tindallia californiensis]SDY78859.1 glycine cleavage system H protein [Tindallia californiensis]
MREMEKLLFTSEHEWVDVQGDEMYMGITDFASKALGDIVFVELPEVDETYVKGDAFGVIESVKAAADMYIPVDGTVLEINTELEDDPGQINQDPLANWFVKIKISDKSQLDELMKPEDYQRFCEEEA